MALTLREIETQLASGFEALSLDERMLKIESLAGSQAVLTTSFGIEDQLLTHLISNLGLNICLVTLDTGRLFPETYTLWQKTEEKYGCRIAVKFPDQNDIEALVADQGINGFYYASEMRKNCCNIRKVKPLKHVLSGAKVWVTGLRRDQSEIRNASDFVSFDAEHNLIKINPLFDWKRDDIKRYTDAHTIPVNTLHQKGFLSIGCAPCTRAVETGELERAGRWWWESESQKECGLHVKHGPNSVIDHTKTLPRNSGAQR
ncbi:phosphoadenylyl-sulfate reductase [Bartonella sp. LJL80]